MRNDDTSSDSHHSNRVKRMRANDDTSVTGDSLPSAKKEKETSSGLAEEDNSKAKNVDTVDDEMKIETLSEPKKQEGLAVAISIDSWCQENGLQGYVQAFKDNEVISMEDLLYLSKEKSATFADEIGMKVVAKNRFLRALDVSKQRLEEPKPRPHSHVSIKNQPVPKESPPVASITFESSTPAMPPGLRTVPHNIITLDHIKAMKDSGSLCFNDFVSLADLNISHSNLKTILVVGSTGSGKTTMINSLMNYLFQVKYEDPFRWKLIDEPANDNRKSKSQSQTDQVLGYLIESPPALGKDKWLLIIDSPGFGDSRGVARDEETVKEIQRFFDKQINSLNAVCFVNKSTETRLGPQQRWLYDKVLSLFGKDIQDIITVLFTFCDASDPPALKVLKDANIGFRNYFKLNNSAFFLKKTNDNNGYDGDDDDMIRPYWQVGMKAFDSFVSSVVATNEHSLDTTRTVLSRREELELAIEQIRDKIDEGIIHLDRLSSMIAMVSKCQSLIEQNKDFEFQVTSHRRVQKPKTSAYNTVCTICQFTCHKDCSIPKDDDKMGCAAMSNGYCMYCPKKCHWQNHKNLDYYYDLESYQETKTNKELEERYVNASSEKSKHEQMVDGIQEEFMAMQNYVFMLVTKVQDAVNELERIALRPNVFHKDEYFDLMVEQERKEKQPGWECRIDMIEKIKDKSKFLSQVGRGDFDPFQEKIEQVIEAAREGKVDCVTKVIVKKMPQKPKQQHTDATQNATRKKAWYNPF